MKIELSAAAQAEILAIIYSQLPEEVQVYAFGSRVSGSARANSDLDLLLCSSHPIPWETLALLEELFADSDLPFRIDLLDRQRTDAQFLKRIEHGLIQLPVH